MLKDSLYFLPAERIAQKFFKPDSENEFIIYEDKGVYCPQNNPYKTNKGRISVTAVCYDCESFIEWISVYDAVVCKGRPKINIKTDDLKEYLEPVEVPANYAVNQV